MSKKSGISQANLDAFTLLERSTELLGEAQKIIEELMEDYSYSSYAEERRDKLAQMHVDIEHALKALEPALENLHDY